MRPRPLQRRVVRGGAFRATTVLVALALITAGFGHPVGTGSPETSAVAAQPPPAAAQIPLVAAESPAEAVQFPPPAATTAPPRRAPTTSSAPVGTTDHDDVPDGEPARVVIPAIGVDASLVPVGLAADGSMQVPDFGIAGWYTEGPRPGHPGPAVVVAHVDSRAGPDVFHRLRELTPGDEIHVVYGGGDQVTFLVESSTQTRKDALPVDDIWPLTRERMLTLVTCGGAFDRSSGHYLDNIIVYTTPTRNEPAPRVPG